jgi:hypothetical protein
MYFQCSTFNIEGIMKDVEEIDADVLCLQEAVLPIYMKLGRMYSGATLYVTSTTTHYVFELKLNYQKNDIGI